MSPDSLTFSLPLHLRAFCARLSRGDTIRVAFMWITNANSSQTKSWQWSNAGRISAGATHAAHVLLWRRGSNCAVRFRFCSARASYWRAFDTVARLGSGRSFHSRLSDSGRATELAGASVTEPRRARMLARHQSYSLNTLLSWYEWQSLRTKKKQRSWFIDQGNIFVFVASAPAAANYLFWGRFQSGFQAYALIDCRLPDILIWWNRTALIWADRHP